MTKLDAGLMTPLPASDPGSAAIWGSKRINPRPQSCLCLTCSGCPLNDDDELLDRNRHALNWIINCIKFCGFYELPLRGHDEVEGSANRGVFLDLVTYMADLEGAFRTHFEKYNVVKNTSKSIQNDFLSCMLKVYTEEITMKIKNSSYVSVQEDETTDISCKS